MARVKKQKVKYKEYYELIFRGYGEDDKIKRIDGAPLKTFEEVASSRDLFGVFKENIIMLDVDDRQSSDVLLQILDELRVSYLYQITTRGCHVFFEHGKYSKQFKDKTHIMLACGLYADVKCRTTDGTKLMKDGEERPVLTSPNYNELIELPYFLVPIGAEREFLGMKEGDSRNSSLYEYILVLLRYGLNKDEVRHTVRIINTFLLEDSFTNKQLDTILRDDAFPTNNEIFIYKQPGSRTATLDFELFAKRMIEVFKISKINDLMYVYENGVYVKLTDEIMEFKIMDLLKNTKSQVRRECKTYLKKFAEAKEVESPNKILFNNGIYDIEDKTLTEDTGESVFFNKLATDFIQDAEPQPIVDKFLNDITCGDESIKKLLLQMIGYSLMRSNPYQVFFFLDGNGKNGKSVLFDFIKYAVGEQNTSSLSIHNLTDRYGVGLLRDKLINIGDDVPQDYIGDTSIIKKAVSGETILVEEKFKDKEILNFEGTLIFSGNGIPKFGDKTDGLMRRIVTVPMKAKFIDKVNRDLNLKDKLLTPANAEYLISLSVAALHEVLTDGFCECEAANEAKHDFEISNNNVYEYFTEHEEFIDGRSTNTVYLSYNTWCQQNGYKDVFSKIKFTNFMKQYGYNTKQIRIPKTDKRERIFFKVDNEQQELK